MCERETAARETFALRTFQSGPLLCTSPGDEGAEEGHKKRKKCKEFFQFEIKVKISRILLMYDIQNFVNKINFFQLTSP